MIRFIIYFAALDPGAPVEQFEMHIKDQFNRLVNEKRVGLLSWQLNNIGGFAAGEHLERWIPADRIREIRILDREVVGQ